MMQCCAQYQKSIIRYQPAASGPCKRRDRDRLGEKIAAGRDIKHKAAMSNAGAAIGVHSFDKSGNSWDVYRNFNNLQPSTGR